MTVTANSSPLAQTERQPEPRAATRALLTRAGERALRAELERLRHQYDVEFSARLKEARGFGEAVDNDDYLQIKEEEAVLGSRIRQLEALLDFAEVVDEGDSREGVVAIGSVVEVENLATGKVREHRLTGGFESLGPTEISVNSPVGQALLGRAAGDEATVELPGGRSVTLAVRSVRAA